MNLRASSTTTGAFASFAALALILVLGIGLADAQTGRKTCKGKSATIVCTNGEDNLLGTPGNDVIHAKGDSDEVDALQGPGPGLWGRRG